MPINHALVHIYCLLFLWFLLLLFPVLDTLCRVCRHLKLLNVSFGFDRSPRSQDVCLCDMMLQSTLEDFLMALKGLKRGPK